MEILRGKQTSFMDACALADIRRRYDDVQLDLGTGDGRFVRHVAQRCPRSLVIGVDANRDNLHAVSRQGPDNMLFVIANAERLPDELRGIAAAVTVNFPWGSLLTGLLGDHSAVMAGLLAVSQADAAVTLRLNAGALAEAGWPLDDGTQQIRAALTGAGFAMRPPVTLGAGDLKACQTTWAKRLAFGRDPRAVMLTGRR
jgi:16S rRNA (adenine(1408)-N(1))-methyltransferase